MIIVNIFIHRQTTNCPWYFTLNHKKAKKKGGKRKIYIYLYMGINKLKKLGVIKHIYDLIKLKGVRSLFKKIRFKMSFKNVN